MLPSHSHPSKAKKTSSRRRSSHSLSPAQYALKIQVLPNACPRVASRISKMMDAHIQRRSRRETYRSQRPEYSHPKPKWLSQFLSSSLWAFEPQHIPPPLSHGAINFNCLMPTGFLDRRPFRAIYSHGRRGLRLRACARSCARVPECPPSHGPFEVKAPKPRGLAPFKSRPHSRF